MATRRTFTLLCVLILTSCYRGTNHEATTPGVDVTTSTAADISETPTMTATVVTSTAVPTSTTAGVDVTTSNAAEISETSTTTAAVVTSTAMPTSTTAGVDVTTSDAADISETSTTTAAVVTSTAVSTSTTGDCFNLDESNHAIYWGTAATTRNGRRCQRWDSQTTHWQFYGLFLVSLGAPSVASQNNYCRDPSGEGYTYCYTTDPDVRWEYCTIPPCPADGECYGVDPEGNVNYWGRKNTTRNGRRCQHWNSQEPHWHNYGNALIKMGAKDLASQENFCRSPDGISKPWCYTTDPKVLWEYCGIPFCPGLECYWKDEKGRAVYTGQKSTTKAGVQCQRWDSQIPHKHNTGSALLDMAAPDVKSQENYCRDPDGTGKPWCYTTDPKLRWDYCGIPKCP